MRLRWSLAPRNLFDEREVRRYREETALTVILTPAGECQIEGRCSTQDVPDPTPDDDDTPDQCAACGLTYSGLEDSDVEAHEQWCPHQDGYGLERFHTEETADDHPLGDDEGSH